MPTTHRSRFRIPDADAPRAAGCGSLCATKARGSPNPPAAFYRYSLDRKGEHAQALLAPESGFLHADAYAGFDKLYEPDPITGCPRLESVACLGPCFADRWA